MRPLRLLLHHSAPCSAFFSTDLGGACKLRWERHTEAQTYTFIRTATEDDCMHPFAESSVAVSVIPGWLAKLPGLVLANVHVAMLPPGRVTSPRSRRTSTGMGW